MVKITIALSLMCSLGFVCAKAQGDEEVPEMEYWFDHSEQQWFVGVSGGYGLLSHTTDMRMLDIVLPDTTISGDMYIQNAGSFYRIGALTDITLATTNRSEIYLTGGIGYVHSSSISNIEGQYVETTDQNGGVVYVQPQHSLAITTDQIDATLGVGFNPKNFAFDLSFCAAYNTYAETINHLQFGEEHTYNTYNTESHSKWLYGLQITARYLIDVDPVQIHIAPNYRYYFNSLHSTATTTVQALSLDVRVGIAEVQGNRGKWN